MDSDDDNRQTEHSPNQAKLVTGIVVVVAVLILAGAAVWYFKFRDTYKIAAYAGNAPTSSSAPTLSFLQGQNQAVPSFSNIKVEYNNKGVKVINSDTNDWTNCNLISVNDYYQGSVTDTGPTISAGSSVFYPYNSFTRVDVRLDTNTVKPSDFTIHCDVSGTLNASSFTLN
jgi:hypothetical protein